MNEQKTQTTPVDGFDWRKAFQEERKISRELWYAFINALPFVESDKEMLSQELAAELRKTRDEYENRFRI